MTNRGLLGDKNVSAPESCPSESDTVNRGPENKVAENTGPKGASLVEYCLLLAIIALTVMLAMPFLTEGVSSAVVKGGSAVLIRR